MALKNPYGVHGQADDSSKFQRAPGLPDQVKKTAKDFHRYAVALEERKDLVNASSGYRRSAATYSVEAVEAEKAGRLVSARTCNNNAGVEYRNQSRIEIDPTVKRVALKNAGMHFGLAAKCANMITTKIDREDHVQRAKWFGTEATDHEKSYTDYSAASDGRTRDSLLKAAVARLRLAFELAFFRNDEVAKQMGIASDYFNRAKRPDLTSELSGCNSWDKITRFTDEVDASVSMEEISE